MGKRAQLELRVVAKISDLAVHPTPGPSYVQAHLHGPAEPVARGRSAPDLQRRVASSTASSTRGAVMPAPRRTSYVGAARA